jgi:hypothetical protein
MPGRKAAYRAWGSASLNCEELLHIMKNFLDGRAVMFV